MRDLIAELLQAAADAPEPDHSVINTVIVTMGVVIAAGIAYLSARVGRPASATSTVESLENKAAKRYVEDLEEDSRNLSLLRDAVRYHGGDPHQWIEEQRERQPAPD